LRIWVFLALILAMIIAFASSLAIVIAIFYEPIGVFIPLLEPDLADVHSTSVTRHPYVNSLFITYSPRRISRNFLVLSKFYFFGCCFGWLVDCDAPPLSVDASTLRSQGLFPPVQSPITPVSLLRTSPSVLSSIYYVFCTVRTTFQEINQVLSMVGLVGCGEWLGVLCLAPFKKSSFLKTCFILLLPLFCHFFVFHFIVHSAFQAFLELSKVAYGELVICGWLLDVASDHVV